jgi:hypothetical protein
MILERVGSINKLGVIMDQWMCFTEHIDFILSKVFSMLGLIRRVFGEFEDSYNLRATLKA